MIQAAYLTGFGSFMPGNPVGNDDIESILGTVNGKPSRSRRIVLRSNGIKNRHYAVNPETGKLTHSNAQLAAEAARSLVAKGKVNLEDIDALCAGTSTPDQLVPNHAVMVHGELRNPPCETVSLAGVCCSSLSALNYGVMRVQTGYCKNVVVCGSELVTPSMFAEAFEPEMDARVAELEANPNLAFEADFLRWMLSDGAGAALVQSAPAGEGPSLRVEWIDVHSFANELPVCMFAGAERLEDGSLVSFRIDPKTREKRGVFHLRQDSKLLEKNIVITIVDGGLGKVRARHPDLRPEDIDWFVPHYSSEYFRQRIADRMTEIGFPIPQEKWFTNLTEKGNIGAAALFVALEELVESGRLQKGERILCMVPESARFSIGYALLTVC